MKLTVVRISSRKHSPIITRYSAIVSTVTKLFVKEAEVVAVGVSRRVGITYVVVGVGVVAIGIGIGWIHCSRLS